MTRIMLSLSAPAESCIRIPVQLYPATKGIPGVSKWEEHHYVANDVEKCLLQQKVKVSWVQRAN